MIFNKKIIFAPLIFLLLINLAYGFNPNHNNLSLEINGWCINHPITFVVWEREEYEDRRNIDEKRIISGEAIIYNGPFDGMPILLETNLDSSGEFEFTFSREDNYMIEINPSGNYNSYQERIELFDCNIEDVPPTIIDIEDIVVSEDDYGLIDEEINPTSSVIEYPEINAILEIINNPNVNRNQISLIENTGFEAGSHPQSEYELKTFFIDLEENLEQETIILHITIPQINNIKVKKYNEILGIWEETPNFNRVGEEIIIENLESGIYSIVEFENERIENNQIEPQINPIDNSNSNQIDNQIIEDEERLVNENEAEEKKLFYPIIILVFLIGIATGGFFLYKKKNESNNNHNNTADRKELIHSYKHIYTRSREYIIQYKDSYSKEQIKQSLKNTNVPEDIINKLFNEIYK